MPKIQNFLTNPHCSWGGGGGGENVVADGGLQPKDKNERWPEVAEGTTSGGRGFSSDAAAGGTYFRALPRHAAAPRFPTRSPPRGTAGSVLASPWPPGAGDAAASFPRGGGGHAPARRGGLCGETRAAPPPRPPAGVFPPRNSKGEQPRTLDPADPRLPAGRQPPGRSSRPAGPAGVRRSRRRSHSPSLETRLDMHQTKKRMAQMKPSCCSSISRLLRTFLSISSTVFGRASGVSSGSMGASAGAEGAASRSVGKRGSLPVAPRRRLHVGRAAARREADASRLRSAAAKQRQVEAGGGAGRTAAADRSGGRARRRSQGPG